jgi:hypothetical protein
VVNSGQRVEFMWSYRTALARLRAVAPTGAKRDVAGREQPSGRVADLKKLHAY